VTPSNRQRGDGSENQRKRRCALKDPRGRVERSTGMLEELAEGTILGNGCQGTQDSESGGRLGRATI